MFELYIHEENNPAAHTVILADASGPAYEYYTKHFGADEAKETSQPILKKDYVLVDLCSPFKVTRNGKEISFFQASIASPLATVAPGANELSSVFRLGIRVGAAQGRLEGQAFGVKHLKRQLRELLFDEDENAS